MAIKHHNFQKKFLTVGPLWLLGLAFCWFGPAASSRLDYVNAQSPGGPSQTGGAALLSVLDPGAIDQTAAPVAYHAPTESGPSRAGSQVHLAGLQESGIIETSPIPKRSVTFPYTLTARQRTAVRSGPSEASYPTDYLSPGETVEVYRHDPDGWLAVRPPEGSFSLIKATQAQPTRQTGVYQVTIDRARAWVGTRVDQSHQPLAQVRLKRGERIAVQSSLEVQEGNTQETWLQIDPPAGEFRWVHQSAFAPRGVTGSADGLAQQPFNSENGDQKPALGNRAGAGEAPDVAPLELANRESEEKTDQWRAAQRDTPEIGYSEYLSASESPEGNSLAGAQSPLSSFQNVSFPSGTPPADAIASPVAAQQREPDAATLWDAAVRRLSQNEHGFYQSAPEGTPSGAPPATLPTTVSNWNQQLNLLNQQLSKQIRQPTEQWDLAPLLQQSEALIQAAPSAAQQDAAGAMQKRILGFLQLQQKKPGQNDLTAGLAGARFASSNGAVFPVGTAGSTTPAMAPAPIAQENPYAAVGYLKELILDRGRQPNSFVLQDINGKTLCHISPMPGVQLHQFLDKKIGVKGRPGYHAQLRLPHVTVDSFDRLD